MKVFCFFFSKKKAFLLLYRSERNRTGGVVRVRSSKFGVMAHVSIMFFFCS